jgi:dTDP-4-amino-4,6-dideoxygalactose transaminase
VHYIPVYWHPYYRDLGYRRGLCPLAEDFYARALSLPIYPLMRDGDVQRVVDTVRRAVAEVA